MIPIGDDNSDHTLKPLVTYVLLALNLFVFFILQGAGSNDRFTYAFSTVPKEIVSGDDLVTSARRVEDPVSGQTFVMPGLQPTPISVYLTLLVSMFMHGGLAHIGGNMLYLWVFGDNLENRLGHLRYLVFYLLTGVLAALAHVFATAATGGNMLVPSLGASGAISGVLGGYIVLYPGRRVRVWTGRGIAEMPAMAAIGLWFAFQLIAGIGLLGGGSQAGGGVAYAAHIGGFVAGVALIKLFDAGSSAAPRYAPARRGW